MFNVPRQVSGTSVPIDGDIYFEISILFFELTTNHHSISSGLLFVRTDHVEHPCSSIAAVIHWHNYDLN